MLEEARKRIRELEAPLRELLALTADGESYGVETISIAVVKRIASAPLNRNAESNTEVGK